MKRTGWVLLLLMMSGIFPMTCVAADDASAVPEAAPVLERTERLDEFINMGEIDWGFLNGQEFPGAKGELTLVKDQPVAGKNALRLAGDFSGGGVYVATEKHFGDEIGGNISRLNARFQSANVKSYVVRVVDGTGQCFQRTGQAFTPGDAWQDISIVPATFEGSERWGGANDGKWHEPLKAFSILLTKDSADDNKPVLLMSDLTARVISASETGASSFLEGFEAKDALGKWQTTGVVEVTDQTPFKGAHSLHLQRVEDQANQPVTATSAPFAISSGIWEFSCAGKVDIYSPDNSYNGEIAVAFLNASGQKIGSESLMILDKKAAWKPGKKRVEVPVGAAQASFVVQMNKTWGSFDVDELSAARIQEKVAPKLVDRITFLSARLGTMFFPEDEVKFTLQVRSLKPLPDTNRKINLMVRDYWGGEAGAPVEVQAERKGFAEGRFLYEASVTLDRQTLPVGKYLELHASIPLPSGKPFTNYIGFARKPLAETKQFKAQDVPFTIRNWDNRMKDYFFLADRLGIRSLGIWGGWDNNPPHAPQAPGIEWVKELGGVYQTLTNAFQVESGTDLSYQSLHDGMLSFLKQYGKDGVHIVCPGNEPHGGTEQKKKNIEAYKAIYQACKEYSSDTMVLSSSMGCEEEYFKLGFQNYCDAYDFHLYEDKNGIREMFKSYEAMMKKYNAYKPIVTTEIGLNCQGMTRNVVAADMIQKAAVFFACGGQLFSWFTIMYPDPDASQSKSNGQAFSVFDSRYVVYSPKIDAITYYNIVNGIGIKKFVEERMYAGEVNAFLFRDKDGNCLVVIWKEKGREDVYLPLQGVDGVKSIQLDGTESTLSAGGKGITLGLTFEPVLLHFNSKDYRLPQELQKPELAVTNAVRPIVKSGSQTIVLQGPGLTPEELVVASPVGWTVSKKANGADSVSCVVTAPDNTEARYGRLQMFRQRNGNTTADVNVVIPVTSAFSVAVTPTPAQGAEGAGASLQIRNNSNENETLNWRFAIEKEYTIKAGNYDLTVGKTPEAFLARESEGEITLAPNEEKTITLPISGVLPQSIYAVKAQVSNNAGKQVESSRLLAGFVGVPHASEKVKADGDLSEAVWKNAPVLKVNDKDQYWPLYPVDKKTNEERWTGPADLSANIRYAWDETYFYLAAEVTDDVFYAPQKDGNIWNQDGLQILVDPQRSMEEKPGKYDYSLASGEKGPQAWCNYSADSAVTIGEAKDIIVGVKRADNQTGNVVYEVAIPWSRFAPFKPQAGANLGLSLIVNDDDKTGRDFMGWFSGVHSKELSMVADLILLNR